ncbi:TfoX/Sxy family DNA transformation protein [Thalassomonas viridans]|uniref:TfoX/Sxy family DNA transformation protein n=1 Tax=Thalassomonas viridans TaxID=137584 RepID=A0AAF0C793_9GAMM|nr:TfoX/Sxy family DNA transformation protein [Thalassomonas viridans]WDE03106.1 TfoX/Sxy family DNA transformation protein [Thalassomonas viridans]
MNKKIRDLQGLGPKSEAALAQIGICNLEDFLAADPYDIYRRLKLSDSGTGLNFLYAIIGARQNCHWQTVAREQKTAILLRLEEMGLAPK